MRRIHPRISDTVDIDGAILRRDPRVDSLRNNSVADTYDCVDSERVHERARRVLRHRCTQYKIRTSGSFDREPTRDIRNHRAAPRRKASRRCA